MSAPMSEAPPEPELGHEYDGIREYDNRLPNWWLMTFYGAIVFAFGYWLYFHTFEIGDSAAEALEIELARAAAEAEERDAAMAAGLSDESLVAMSSDAAVVARGKEVFTQNCLACHGANGEGTVGPNLTDAYWINGHRPTDIHGVIADGRLAKGMPSWKAVLGGGRVRDVAAFVLSLKNTHVPGKAPEGVDENGAAPGQKAPAGQAPLESGT